MTALTQKIAHLTLLLTALFLLTAMSPVASTPIERDIPYAKAGDAPLCLDVSIPQEGHGPYPAVVFIHGGGWQVGSKNDMSQLISDAAKNGYVGIAPQYRLAPKAHFPAQIHDCKAVIRWLRANAEQYKIDPDRIAVVGFSAGGHLASLLGTTAASDDLEGTPKPDHPPDPTLLTDSNPAQSTKVQAVVDFFGPTDFTTRDWDPKLEKDVIVPFLNGTIKENPDLYKKASPITYAAKDAPPFLIIHGTNDNIVPIDQSQRFAKKLQDLGVSTQLVILQNETHAFTPAAHRKAFQHMSEFLNQHLKKAPAP